MQTSHRNRSHRVIKSFEAQELAKRPFAIKIADWLTSVFGGVSFLIFNALFFFIWILVNSGKVPGIPVFDHFPYPLLTSIVSLEAIFLSIIVLMSAQRQSYISSLREELDMQVNLLSEREITKLLKIVTLIGKKHGIDAEDSELKEMLEETDLTYIERKLEEQLEDKKKITS